MKNYLSLSIAGWLCVGLFGCGGSDGSDGNDEVAPATMDAVPGAADAVPVNVPADTSDPPSANIPRAAAQGSDADTIRGETPLAVAPPAELRWRACGQFENRNIECAELDVPIDYALPDGDKVTLALRRILASPLEPYRGALLFNPGGPGGEGIDTALSYFQGGRFNEIAPGFDIIGFDPRGVAESGERGCGIFPEEMYPGAMATEEDGGAESFVQELENEGAECEREWGPLFRKLGSNNVVRDMDEIRKALKERVLNFYGASYGTRLGALYAHAYPGTTGRIVLDAPVHPRANFVEVVRGQFHQAITLHEKILVACEDGRLDCPPNARGVFEQILANAEARGMRAAVVGTWESSLASPLGVESILAALGSEFADPGGDWIESFVAGGSGGSGIGIVPNRSVHCTDDTVEPPTLEQLESLAAEFVEASPLFAADVLSTALCTGWPTTRDPVPLPTALDAPPLLVIGGLADALTPYEWAQAMTETLGNATLLTSRHFGHGALSWAGTCVQQNIRAYLTSGSMPATGATCE